MKTSATLSSVALATVGATVLAIALRYLVWRFFSTVVPYPADWSFGFFWAWFVFLVELGAFADILLFLTAMSRYVNRSAEADRLEREFFARDPKDLPAVDVFIPTYNEPLDVLERTIIGALALDYPKDKLKILPGHPQPRHMGDRWRPVVTHVRPHRARACLKYPFCSTEPTVISKARRYHSTFSRKP
ncbi:hypothetical protein Mnod_6101 [Methylobacterium nodulans ORS 2060]|uniref:Uncharacterized protein n=1 Tax=Methylobacterium nodulans (strain LMG 21967 / CNCM I-2342 / ORS 2060) TaxID=460265 RepID=B8IV75_METNO|nr:hypothetical protein Mnod_6101 [Methylobacterium nodulans ORS 2060]